MDGVFELVSGWGCLVVFWVGKQGYPPPPMFFRVRFCVVGLCGSVGGVWCGLRWVLHVENVCCGGLAYVLEYAFSSMFDGVLVRFFADIEEKV